MKYLDFLLLFCAIMMIFEFAWIFVAYTMLSISKIFKSVNAVKTYVVIEKILYCFLIISLAVITINKYRDQYESILFLIFMILMALIYLIFFFSDKRYNTEKKLSKSNFYSLFLFEKLINFQIIIETISIIVFIPLVFLSNLITNTFVIYIFNWFYYIANIKIIGTVIGIFGLLVLLKYIQAVGLSILFLKPIRKKILND